nr:peptidylprolyl isomerase [uncultured Brevundimonas sp.]
MRKAIIAAGLAALLASSAVQAQTAAPAAAPVAASADDWRTIAPENLLVIDTAKGRILVELIPVAAPNHAERIRTLANQGFYDGLKFHRVIPGFMAQTGDPKGTGEGGSDLPDLKAEFHFRRGRDAGFVAVPNAGAGLRGLVGDLPVQTQPDAQMMVTADFKVDAHGLFCPGVLGMARSGSPDSANSQFFLMMGARDQLDGVYTAFGRVVSGMDVLDKIKKGSDAEDGKVTDPDVMTHVRMASGLPEGQRPTVRVLNASSAAFADRIAAARTARGASFSICDVQPVAEVVGG